MTEEHYGKLEKMYLGANINQEIYETTTVNIGEGTAEIGLTIDDKYFHALGAIHGSVYFKLLDDAAFFAANSVVYDVFVLTTNFNIQLVRPVTQGKLLARGSLRSASKNLLVADSVLFDESGKEVAFGTGNFMKSTKRLLPEIGYM